MSHSFLVTLSFFACAISGAFAALNPVTNLRISNAVVAPDGFSRSSVVVISWSWIWVIDSVHPAPSSPRVSSQGLYWPVPKYIPSDIDNWESLLTACDQYLGCSIPSQRHEHASGRFNVAQHFHRVFLTPAPSRGFFLIANWLLALARSPPT